MSLRHRFWLLATLRWLPTGLIVPVVTLLPLDRGLTIAEYGAVAAVQGIVVLFLELPTGGLTDAMGRRPVYLASAVVALAAYIVYALAPTMLVFAVATALAGVFRALDSGPLNAWFVDAVHDDPDVVDRAEAVARGLSGYASVVGIAIGAGAIISGGLVAWAPLGDDSALSLPYWVAAGLTLVQLVTIRLLMTEDRSSRAGDFIASLRATPGLIRAGAGLVIRSRVLRALVALELFWGFGMVAFESLTPIRLSELVESRDVAAAMMGPVTATAWGVSAAGAAAVPLLLRRWSLVTVSVALRLVQGATVVGMGLAGGPLGLIVGFFATYAVHMAAGAIYETLLHEQVDRDHRATVLSLASMVMHPAASIGSVVLGAIATGASTPTALMIGGVVLAIGAPLFLVRERQDPPPMLGRDDGAALDGGHHG